MVKWEAIVAVMCLFLAIASLLLWKRSLPQAGQVEPERAPAPEQAPDESVMFADWLNSGAADIPGEVI